MPLNLLPPALWQSVPFKDRDAFLDWSLHHQLEHEAIAKITGGPILLFDDLKSEMLRHAELHDSQARALGITPAADLASYDLNDRSSYYSFMTAHSLDHARLRKAAGL